jgi:hypothetical protein
MLPSYTAGYARSVDLDVDGYNDIIIGGLGDDEFSIFINRRTNNLSFLMESELVLWAYHYRSDMADFDGDGDPDMVASFFRTGFGYYENVIID